METAHDDIEINNTSTSPSILGTNCPISSPHQTQEDAHSVAFRDIIEEIRNHEHSKHTLFDLGQILETDSDKFLSELPALMILMLEDIVWRYESLYQPLFGEHHRFEEQFIQTTLSFLDKYIPNNVTMPQSADLYMAKLCKYDLSILEFQSYSSQEALFGSITDVLRWFDDFQQNKRKFSTQFKWKVVDCVLNCSSEYAIPEKEYKAFLSFHQRLPLRLYVIEDFIRRVRCHDGSTKSDLKLHERLFYLERHYVHRTMITYKHSRDLTMRTNSVLDPIDRKVVYGDELAVLDAMDMKAFDKLLSFLCLESSLNESLYLHTMKCFMSVDWYCNWYNVMQYDGGRNTVQSEYCRRLLKKHIDDGNINLIITLLGVRNPGENMVDRIADLPSMPGFDPKMFISALIQRINDCSGIDDQMISNLNILWSIIDSKGMRKSALLDVQKGSISDGFRDCLRQIYCRFASNEDGSMSALDFRRSIIAAGAPEAAASYERIASIFHQYEQMDATKLSFEGFCNFYKGAAFDRPRHVWIDLFVHQFLPNFKINDGVYEQDSLRDIMAKDEMYEEMVHKIFRCEVPKNCNFDYQTRIRLWFQWPQSHVLRQRMFDSNTSIEDIFPSLGIMTEGNAKQIMYQAMTLHSLCQRDEWRKHFVEKGGMDCAVGMLLCLGWSSNEKGGQELEMASADIISALYRICYGNGDVAYPRHLFLRNAMILMNLSKIGKMPIFSRNALIHVICHSASNSNFVDFVDELPRNVVCIHSLPLIQGYVWSEFIPSAHIPDEMVKLLTHFF